jgi:hypothetical protein
MNLHADHPTSIPFHFNSIRVDFLHQEIIINKYKFLIPSTSDGVCDEIERRESCSMIFELIRNDHEIIESAL